MKKTYDPSKAIGKKYNDWTVLEFDHKNKWNTNYYKCKCSCGNIKVVAIRTVKHGLGHCQSKVHNERYNIIGQKYGKLTVLKEVEATKFCQRQFLCKCECGKEKIIIGPNLIYGDSTSCGCNNGYVENTKLNLLQRQEAYPNSKSGIKGVWQDKGYWRAIITVCGKRIPFYGGAGEEGKRKCIEWRKKMVKKYHEPLINKYSKY